MRVAGFAAMRAVVAYAIALTPALKCRSSPLPCCRRRFTAVAK